MHLFLRQKQAPKWNIVWIATETVYMEREWLKEEEGSYFMYEPHEASFDDL